MPYHGGSRAGAALPAVTLSDPRKALTIPAQTGSAQLTSLDRVCGAEAELDAESALLNRRNLERFCQSAAHYRQWDSQSYLQATLRAFDHTVVSCEQYKAALFEALLQQKPVVLMLGPSSRGATRQIIENSLKDARDRSGGQAVFVYMDVDRIDPDSQLGKYASGLEEQCGFPLTLCFTVFAGDDNRPAHCDPPIYSQTGPVSANKLCEAINLAKLAMCELDLDHLIRSGSNSLNLGGDRPSETLHLLDQAVSKRSSDRKASHALFRLAVEASDREADPALRASARAEFGLACLYWGFPDQGLAWILEAGKLHPQMYKSEKFRERLRMSDLPPQTAVMLITEGQRCPAWFEANRTRAIQKLKAPGQSQPHSGAISFVPAAKFPSPFQS